MAIKNEIYFKWNADGTEIEKAPLPENTVIITTHPNQMCSSINFTDRNETYILPMEGYSNERMKGYIDRVDAIGGRGNPYPTTFMLSSYYNYLCKKQNETYEIEE